VHRLEEISDKASARVAARAFRAWAIAGSLIKAGLVNPIKQSSVYFDTTAAARRAGKEALKDLLNKLFA
jgi:hypothetical protein